MAKPKLPAALDMRKNGGKPTVKKKSSKTPGPSVSEPVKKAGGAPSAATAPHRLPNSFVLMKNTLRLCWQWRWLLLGIAAVYALMNLILLGGVRAATDLSSIRDVLNEHSGGGAARLGTGIALYTLVVSDANNQFGNALGTYQLISLIITSLAVIWMLRQLMAGVTRLRIRDGFYKGMYPLVPVILVLLVIVLQLLPLVIGASLYALLTSNDIVVGLLEKILWLIPLVLGLAITAYWLTSSLIAAYIVTLPDMTPLKALRSARGLVRYRRWPVLRRLLFLPLVLLMVSVLIMLPVVLTITSAAPWFFFVLSSIGIVLVHAYMYNLYRELLV